MPELPEVETIRRDLERVLLGKEITDVQLRTKRLVKNDPVTFLAHLIGNTVTRIQRRGKLLQFHLAHSEHVLHVHLKMTGQLICQVEGGLIAGGHPSAKIDNLPNAYTHVVFTFEGGTVLYFNDVRTFGYLNLVEPQQHETALLRFGYEPLDPAFDAAAWTQLLKGRRGKLKAFLLNQAHVAGIGNIYADEICFRARVRPQRDIAKLSRTERSRIFTAIKAVIGSAVEKRGTTFSNFVDAAGKKGGYMPFLKVYGRQGERCKRCGSTEISKTVFAGRGTHFCALCQK